MNIYKINSGYFEVIEDEMMDDVSGYKLSVNRRITNIPAAYTFKNETYYNVSINEWNLRQEITEQEFVDALNNQVETAWKEVGEAEKNANGGAFTLSKFAVSTRDAYMKTYGVDRMEFLNTVYSKYRM